MPEIHSASTPHADFREALSEVGVVLGAAETSQKDTAKYSTFNKAALLLLMAKFESFLEDAVADFSYAVQELKLPSEQIPEYLRKHCTEFLLDDECVHSLRKLRGEAIEKVRLLLPLWGLADKVDSLRVDNRFDYGRHGSKQMRKLFRRIGVGDVFQSCPITGSRENLSTGRTEAVAIDMAGGIDSMTNFRNMIIHQDASPPVTHVQIGAFMESLLKFSSAVVQLLRSRVEGLRVTGQSCPAVQVSGIPGESAGTPCSTRQRQWHSGDTSLQW